MAAPCQGALLLPSTPPRASVLFLRLNAIPQILRTSCLLPVSICTTVARIIVSLLSPYMWITLLSFHFNTLKAYEQALTQWPRDCGFVLVTNHHRNCDDEDERGIFFVTGLGRDNETATVKASVDRQDIQSITSSMEVTFSRFTAIHLVKRDITFDQTGIDTAGNISLPTDQQLFSKPPYFSATAHKANLLDNVTLSGYLMYYIYSTSLSNLYFDLDASFAADLALIFDFTAPRAAIAASAQFNAFLALSNGRVHIDFLDSNNTQSSGWAFTPYMSIDKVERRSRIPTMATLHADPTIDFSVEIAVCILAGMLGLSGGFTTEPKFVNGLS
ncbi:hypothetical protein HD806DRAFT_538513 [Xylariaceae sp. AK1471]|nr:hypothetical protein HD806DRAFT_538513 [Xylariaceae sp. AK1471]